MADLYMDVDAALAEVPVNILPLLDDTDFKSIEGAVAFNASGMALRWHFVTPAGAYTVTSVTPTSAGDYDWTDQGDSGVYTIEIPASGGASINNDTEGFGWFTGVATGILPWRGPIICFRAAGLNDKLVESAYDATRGLAGTALPGVAAEGAGGLYTRGSGAGQIVQVANGMIDANVVRNAGTAITAAAGIQEVKVASIANDAITAAAIANAAIDAATFAAGAIDAAAIATDAIGANELAAGAVTEIQSGLATTADVATIVGYIDTEVAAILAAVDTEVAAIKAVTDLFTAAQAEPTAVPAANATPLAKIAFIGMLARNKITQSATENKIFADDGSTVVVTYAVSDSGTVATRGEGA